MIELLVIFYMLICLLMMVYNFAFMVAEHMRERRLALRVSTLVRQCEVHAKLAASGKMHPHELLQLEAQLKTIEGMEAFDTAMERLHANNAIACAEYLQDVAPLFERLSSTYTARPDLERAYFAHILGSWYASRPASERVLDALRKDLLSSSLYVRQNAFEALAHTAPAHVLVRALCELDLREAGAYSPRLITETLLAFEGDAAELGSELNQVLPKLSISARCAVINYLRMTGEGNAKSLLELMDNTGEDIEVRLACIRYFMRNPHKQAFEALLAFCQDDTLWNAPVKAEVPAEENAVEEQDKNLKEIDGEREAEGTGDAEHIAVETKHANAWQYAAVSAMALRAYPGEATINMLKRLLSSRVWFVRYNAAASLHALGCTLEGELADVMAGSDRYAREMLIYRWQLEDVEQKDGQKRGLGGGVSA